jgi:peptidoglycan/LPS O-acetylase OafA/YrhL
MKIFNWIALIALISVQLSKGTFFSPTSFFIFAPAGFMLAYLYRPDKKPMENKAWNFNLLATLWYIILLILLLLPPKTKPPSLIEALLFLSGLAYPIINLKYLFRHKNQMEPE